MFTDVFLCPAVRGLASDLSLLTIVFPTMIIFCSYRQTQQTGVLLCPAVEDRRVSCLNTVFLTGLFLRKRNTHAFFYVQLSEVKRMSCLALPSFFFPTVIIFLFLGKLNPQTMLYVHCPRSDECLVLSLPLFSNSNHFPVSR